VNPSIHLSTITRALETLVGSDKGEDLDLRLILVCSEEKIKHGKKNQKKKGISGQVGQINQISRPQAPTATSGQVLNVTEITVGVDE
jgi:hypothetical protein